ncbi:rod shape-determining protein MreC [Rickettsiales bacterium]|nr:rod shape-determining protein MreC [Rickettsiales bacterium]
MNQVHTGSGALFHLSRSVRIYIRRLSFFVLVAFALFIVFIGKVDSPFARNVRSVIADVFAPVLEVLSIPSQMMRDTNDKVGGYFFIYKKNQELKEQKAELVKQLAEYSRLKVENAKLKQLLNYVKDRKYSYISARAVGDVSGPFVRSVLLNVGENGGVKKGQAVVGNLGLVGRIIEVNRYTSRVLLLTDINSHIPVISSISRERSIMAGRNDSYPSLVYLSEDSRTTAGEYVETSGDGDLFPSGIPIGILNYSEKNKLEVIPFMKWNRLEHLSVINYD